MSSSRDPNARAAAHDPGTLAMLSAFLDGELSAADERALLQKLEQHPELQDVLDDLAEQVSLTRQAFDLDDDAVAQFAPEIDSVMEAVLAGLPADALTATPEAARSLAFLAADDALDDAQARVLQSFIDADDALAVEAADTMAFVDATAAVLPAVGNAPSLAATFARLPEFVLAKVERTERAWALAGAAADGALDDAEAAELQGLCGADVDLFDACVAAFADAHQSDAAFGSNAAIGDALRAFAESPALAPFAARAGDAALHAIAAAQLQAAAAAPAATATTTAAGRPAVKALVPSTWDRLVGIVRQGFAPMAAAAAAGAAFVVIGLGEPQTAGPAEPGTSRTLAEVRNALFDSLQPIVMAQNAMLPNAEDLPVLADNSADVEAIDATSTTMVFQTAESNITVIWVAGLDEDDAIEEQGT